MRYERNGISFNVLEQGNGPLTLVFLHYFGGSAIEWQSVMTHLSDQYRCIAIDLRGHGDSDSPGRSAGRTPVGAVDSTETGYSVGTMADDVAGLIQHLKVTDFVLIGHSMGGKVALALASRQPAGFRSLLLLSPSPPVPEPIPESDREQMLATHGQRAAAEQTFGKITAKPVSEDIKAQIIIDNLRTSAAAWTAWLTVGSIEDISAQMASITVSVSILIGTADKAIAPDVQQTMTLPYLKTATIASLKGVGHLSPWEVPEEVTAFIRKKIAELSTE